MHMDVGGDPACLREVGELPDFQLQFALARFDRDSLSYGLVFKPFGYLYEDSPSGSSI